LFQKEPYLNPYKSKHCEEECLKRLILIYMIFKLFIT